MLIIAAGSAGGVVFSSKNYKIGGSLRLSCSAKPEARVFTSNKAKFDVFGVFHPPPTERAGDLVFTCENSKLAGLPFLRLLIRILQKLMRVRTKYMPS